MVSSLILYEPYEQSKVEQQISLVELLRDRIDV